MSAVPRRRDLLARRRVYRPWSGRSPAPHTYPKSAPAVHRSRPIDELELAAIILAADEVIKARRPRVPEELVTTWADVVEHALELGAEEIIPTVKLAKRFGSFSIRRDSPDDAYEAFKRAMTAALEGLYAGTGAEGWAASSRDLRVEASYTMRQDLGVRVSTVADLKAAFPNVVVHGFEKPGLDPTAVRRMLGALDTLMRDYPIDNFIAVNAVPLRDVEGDATKYAIRIGESVLRDPVDYAMRQGARLASATPEGLMAHEYGHVVAENMTPAARKAAYAAVGEVSAYARSSPAERWAEDFSLTWTSTHTFAGDNLAQRVVGILAQTRDEIQRLTSIAIDRGYSVDQLARGVPGDAFPGLGSMFDRNRAMLIARTETANAYNLGSIDRYTATGLIDKVNVYDGASCGWSSHTDPRTANGLKVTLAEASQQPISHPNCQRAFGPIVAGAPPGGAPDSQKVPKPIVGPRPTASVQEVQARAISARRFSQASRAEPKVTADLHALADRTDAIDGFTGEATGAPTGLDFKLKGDMNRTVQKIMEDVDNNEPITKAGQVKDALRYTIAYPEGRFYAGMQESITSLRSAGYTMIKARDSMSPSRSPFNRDVLTAWRAEDGTRFELQFHTPSTFYRKNIAGGADGTLRPSHAAYEELRELPKSAVEHKDRLEAELRSIWDGVDEPANPWGWPPEWVVPDLAD